MPRNEPSSPPSSVHATPNKRARLEHHSNGYNSEDSDAVYPNDEDTESVDLDHGTLPPANYNPEAEQEILDEEHNYEITADRQPFAPGAIVRIKLKNFVTYADVEFHPGPSLNMIIGPNGSGKSSIVCAICLGLGWSPTHLGRAEAIGEYVKHNTPKATVEIELQGRSDEENHVIKRTIIRENNGSSYELNRKTQSSWLRTHG